jgi:hypothetical protein
MRKHKKSYNGLPGFFYREKRQPKWKTKGVRTLFVDIAAILDWLRWGFLRHTLSSDMRQSKHQGA